VGIDDDLTDPQDRIVSLRDDLARLREHARTVEPGRQAETEAVLAELEGRLGDTRERLTEGADVTVQLGALQTELAMVERELLLTDARARHDRADPDQVVAEREELLARGEAVRSLAQRALETINPAPRLGIPDVAALGEVPTDEDELTTYVGNLERVSRALDQAHSTYAAALAEYADLADRAQRLAKTLAGCGAPTSVDLAGMLTAAKESLNNRPADIQRAAALVAAQEAYLAELRPDA
jgi:chromosome segregation ATPase